MRLLYGHDDAVAQFVAGHIPGCERGFGDSRAIGVIDDDGSLVAGLVFHNYSPEGDVIEISAAGLTPRWLTRPILKAMFAYPFDGIDCQLVVMRVSEFNARLHRILMAYGCEAYFIPRLRGRNEGEFVFTLSDDAWRKSRFNVKRLV